MFLRDCPWSLVFVGIVPGVGEKACEGQKWGGKNWFGRKIVLGGKEEASEGQMEAGKRCPGRGIVPEEEEKACEGQIWGEKRRLERKIVSGVRGRRK